MTQEQINLTFSKYVRVTVDGELSMGIPDGYKYSKTGYGGNSNWLYIVPEKYSLDKDHIEAKPLSFGIVPTPFFAAPDPISKNAIDGCKKFLLDNNVLQPGIAISECICSEHCFFIYQRWYDSNDNLYNKMNGVLFAGDKLYQFHVFMNHDNPVSDNQDIIRYFELVSRQWMKQFTLSNESAYRVKGDPDEVRATLDDLSRMFKLAKEKMLPTISDDLGSDLRNTYALISTLFYSKNGKQIDSSNIHLISRMIGEVKGQTIDSDYLTNLIKKSNTASITDIINGFAHDTVLKTLVTMDKISNAGVEGGLTMVHFIGVQILLKTLCAANNLDYDLSDFCLECIESLRSSFNEKWKETDAYMMNDSTLVIHNTNSTIATSASYKKQTNTKKKAPSKNKTGFSSPNVSSIRTQLLSNTNGYAVRFVSMSEVNKESSDEESIFRDRMTWLHPEYPEKVAELREYADKYVSILNSEEEQNDIANGLLVNTAPIHALRSLLWTALSADDSDNPFENSLEIDYWLSMAGFIESHNFVNYKPLRNNEIKIGADLIRKEEFKLSYSDYCSVHFDDKKLDKQNYENGSLIELTDTLMAMQPVIELYFDHISESADSGAQGLNAMRNIIIGWTALAYACNCPFAIIDESKISPKTISGGKTSWASLSEIKKIDNGRITVIGNTLFEILDDSEVVNIPEGVEAIYPRFGETWNPKRVKKVVYPSTYTDYIYIPDNIEEVEIFGDHDDIYIYNHVDENYKDENDEYIKFINLRKLSLKGDIKKIGYGFDLFEAAKNLKELNLPEGLIEIEEPFMSKSIYYNFIEHLYLPESLMTIYDGMFSSAISTRDNPTTKVYVYRSCPAFEEIKSQIEESKEKTDNEGDYWWVDHSKYPFELILR